MASHRTRFHLSWGGDSDSQGDDIGFNFEPGFGDSSLILGPLSHLRFFGIAFWGASEWVSE